MENKSFLEGKILPSLIKFALPLVLSLILQALYGAVDLMVVGKFGSTASVSAVATSSQVMHAITGIIIGLTTGVTVLIGQAIGAKEPQKCTHIINGMVKLLAIIIAILTILLVVFAEQIAHFMNIPADAFDSSVIYLRICGIGTIFIALYNAISGIYRGVGNSASPLLFIFIACIINIIGDLVLVGIFKLDAAGAAIATVLAQAVSVIFSLFYMKKGKLPFAINLRMIKSTNSVRQIVKVGLPIATQDFLTSVSFLIITSIVNELGVVASASLGITEKLFIFLALIPLAFMSALSAFVAQNIGAGKYDRAKKSLALASAISFGFGVLMFLLTFFAGDKLAMIFENNPLVIKATANYFKSCSFEQLFVAILFCFSGFFNGCGKTTFVMAQGLATSFLVRIPLSYFLSRLENTSMLLIGIAVPASAFVGLILSIIYFIYLERKKKIC